MAPSERGPALYELDLETGSVTPKIYNIGMFDWYLDRERVIYTPIPHNGEDRMEMRVANLRTGQDGDYHVHNGGWSPDGREIVYTRDLDAGDIYVIEPR